MNIGILNAIILFMATNTLHIKLWKGQDQVRIRLKTLKNTWKIML